MSATSDAIEVAKYLDGDARGYTGRARSLSGESGVPMQRMAIAAAERVLVERGLGEEYGLALWVLLGEQDLPESAPEKPSIFGVSVAAIRTAPPEVCLRALARVVREKQPKETK